MGKTADQPGNKSLVQHTWVIHGTWNPPTEDKTNWFQLDGNNVKNFCDRLAHALSNGSLSGSVWRNTHKKEVFSWSGKNDHEARLSAGKKLAERIITLRKSDTQNRINLVAHSHGGNVVLHACEQYRRYLVDEAVTVYRLAVAHRASAFKTNQIGDQEFHSSVLKQVFENIDPHTMELYGRIIDDILIDESYKPDYHGFENHDRYNQPERAFINGWLEEDASHIIRNLVFFGTPFLAKHWERPSSKLFSKLKSLLSYSTHLLRSLFLAYMVAFPVVLISAQLTGDLSSILKFYPAEWGNGELLIWAMSAIFFFFVFSPSNKIRYDTDLYFDPNTYLGVRFTDRLAPDEVVPKINALVVTATYMDEAFIGLASEPLVYAKLAPRIKSQEWLWKDAKARLLEPLDEAKIGVGTQLNIFNTAVGPGRYSNSIVEWPQKVIRNVVVFFLRAGRLCKGIVWKPISKWIWEPFLIQQILDVMNGFAFGVSSVELKHARVVARSSIGLPEFFEEDLWDITEDMILNNSKVEASDVQPFAKPKRYGFLVDNEALTNKMRDSIETDSGLWNSMVGEMRSLEQRERKFTRYLDVDRETTELWRNDFNEKLAKITFSVEERAKEVTDSIELNHSHYYNSDKVIANIAKFLETGSRGETSI